MTTEEKITLLLHQIFHGGDRVSNKQLKETIQAIYNQLGWTSCKAKGTDITKFGFGTKRCKIRVGKDRVDGVELSTLDHMLQKHNNTCSDEETNK